MGYSNGLLCHNVDDNLTGETRERDEKSQKGIGFKLTPDGNYDTQKKRLTNATDGVNPNKLVAWH